MTLRQTLIGNEDERAVSPVIGVILMVAITVILAAVIAAFVLDIGSGLEDQAQAGVQVTGDDTATVKVTVESLGNADGVAIVDPASGDLADTGGDDDDAVDSLTTNSMQSVGTEATINANTSNSGEYDYNVVAYHGADNDRSGENIVASFTVNA